MSDVDELHGRFDELSETQKRLLREVAEGRSSKEMSRAFGLEPRTIEVYLSRAGKTLGFADRQSAAVALVQHEAAMLTRCILTSEPIASRSELEQPSDRRGLAAWLGWFWIMCRKARIALARKLGLPPVGGREQDYGFNDRMAVSFRIAGSGFLVIIALTMMISGLMWAF